MPLLDDMMFQNGPMANAPMIGGMLNPSAPGLSPRDFRNRWAGVAGMPPMQSAAASPLPIAQMFGGGGVPMPQPRPDGAPMQGQGAPPPAPMPPPSSPDVTAPAPTSSGGPDAIPQTSLLGRVGNSLNANPQTLLRMAAGFAGAPSLGTGMSRGFAGAAEGMQADQKQNALGMTYQALVKSGVAPAQAMAAVAAHQAGNSSLLAALAAKHLGPQHLAAVGEGQQLRHPLTGELIAQGAPKVETIQRGLMGPVSVQRNAAGGLEQVNPGSLPQAGQPPTQVNTIEDALRLPKGTPFVGPDGIPRVR